MRDPISILPILERMGDALHVADAATGELLFVNEACARLHPPISGDAPCWQALYGREAPCLACPMRNADAPQTVAVPAADNEPYPIRLEIEWDGRRAVASIEPSADRKARAEAEACALIGVVSKKSIAAPNDDEFIDSALGEIGEFMSVAQGTVSALDATTDTLKGQHDWINGRQNASRSSMKTFAFTEGKALREAFIELGLPYLAHPDPTEALWSEPLDSDVRAFLAVPVFVEGALWGVLSWNADAPMREWSGVDAKLSIALAEVVAGVVARGIRGGALALTSRQFDASPVPTYRLDWGAAIMIGNRAAAELAGVEIESLRGMSADEAFSDGASDRIRREIIPRVHSDGECAFELAVRDRAGGEKAIPFRAYSIGPREGSFGLVAWDLSDRGAGAAGEPPARGDAEGASLVKAEFLSRMSHEMRTPMNAIIGMTNIAKASQDVAKMNYCLDKIEQSSRHLLGIINDVLDMSKIETNQFELHYGELNFEKMLNRVIGGVDYSLNEKQQQLRLHLDRSMPPVIVSDERHLAQVISNILSNAVKFTPNRGTISLSTHLLEIKDGVYTFELSINDTGIGMSDEQIRRLFLSFEQGDGGIARRYEGAGLGLAITKKIVDLMGGEIRVASKLGIGSTFTVKLGVKRGTLTTLASRSEDVSWETIRILAVDDSLEIREYFMSIAHSLHLNCDVAEGGEQALEMIREADPPYNLVFADWMMPGMDGIEMTREIKRLLPQSPVVVMVTSAELHEIEEEARAAGVDRFVSKPLVSSMLADSINEYLGVQVVSLTSMGKKRNYTGKTILLAEDIDINRDIVIALLEETNVRIIPAVNGLEAVRMFEQTPDGYDIILMDVHMPIMNGMEATEHIRAIPTDAAKRIPIVALTANVFREDIEECLKSGMNDHIAKPIDKDELLALLDKHFALQADAAVRSAFREVTIEKTVESGEAGDYAAYLPTIHVEAALGKLMNNKALFLTLISNFGGQSMVDELKRVIVRNDSAKTAQAAQALGGSAYNLGLNRLGDAASGIEKRARAKISSDDLIPALDEAMKATADAIARLLDAEGAR